MKKLFAIGVAALVSAASLISCGPKVKYNIGAIQFVAHPALDASYNGFVDALKEKGLEEGKDFKIDFQNAQNEQSNCVTIADKLVSNRSSLILAIATPAAQAVAARTKEIPVLVTAVTDPKTAGLVESNELPGTNISGTSDLTPCAAQIDLLKRLVPNAKKVAMLYCSSEANSTFQIDLAKKRCDEVGLDYVDATVSNSNEIQQVVQNLVGKVDAIYTPTDNMIASCMPTVGMVTTPNRIPVICGEEGMVSGGGLATFGINYYELGKQTGLMAYDILVNGAKPAEMPIQYMENCVFSYNAETAEKLGIKIPEDLLKTEAAAE